MESLLHDVFKCVQQRFTLLRIRRLRTELTKANLHTADGISVRFPRVTRIRDDKNWETATNLDELKHLYKTSKEKTDVTLLNKLAATADDNYEPPDKKTKQSPKQKKMTASPAKNGLLDKFVIKDAKSPKQEIKDIKSPKKETDVSEKKFVKDTKSPKQEIKDIKTPKKETDVSEKKFVKDTKSPKQEIKDIKSPKKETDVSEKKNYLNESGSSEKVAKKRKKIDDSSSSEKIENKRKKLDESSLSDTLSDADGSFEDETIDYPENPLPDAFIDKRLGFYPDFISIPEKLRDTFERHWIAYGGVMVKSLKSMDVDFLVHNKDVIEFKKMKKLRRKLPENVRHVTKGWLIKCINWVELCDTKDFAVFVEP